MKKYKWNKSKFAINILKAECMILTVLIYDAMFLYAIFK